jgi:branched-chain amino acid transport system ATP-binding protein
MTNLANGGNQTVAVRTDLAVEVDKLSTGYLGKPIVYDVSYAAERGKITALFGHNGAGKTSSLKAMSGLLPMFGGTLKLFGEDYTTKKIDDRVRAGIIYLPQERAVFRGLNVRDNLELGAALEHDKKVIAERRDNVIDLFPRLGERLKQYAETMSGGEQRMLAMGIALMAGAKILLLDEPSLGLSPQINLTLLDATKRLCDEQGLTVILVEQAIGAALDYVDYVYVMRSGSMVAEHDGDEARAREDWWRVF